MGRNFDALTVFVSVTARLGERTGDLCGARTWWRITKISRRSVWQSQSRQRCRRRSRRSKNLSVLSLGVIPKNDLMWRRNRSRSEVRKVRRRRATRRGSLRRHSNRRRRSWRPAWRANRVCWRSFRIFKRTQLRFGSARTKLASDVERSNVHCWAFKPVMLEVSVPPDIAMCVGVCTVRRSRTTMQVRSILQRWWRLELKPKLSKHRRSMPWQFRSKNEQQRRRCLT